MRFDRRLPHSLRLLPLIAGLAAVGTARADDPNPYFIGVSQTISHESNIYQTPDGTPSTGDTLYSTALIGGIDQAIGRERLFGNLSLRRNTYGSNTSLNNNGYGATLGLDWATIDRISGNFLYRGNRELAQLNSTGGGFVSKNLQTTQEFDATARMGVVTRLTGVLEYSYRKLDQSAPEYSYLQFHQNAISAGLNYSSSSALTFGGALRHTEGHYPSARTGASDPLPQNAADDFHRNDIDLTTQWIPTGASTLNARLSFGRESHTLAQERSFSGATGNVSWDWRPTGKLQFVTSLLHDTGQQSTFYQLALNNNTLLTTTGDVSRITNSLQVQAKYAATAKISINAALRADQRSLVSTASASQQETSGHDRLNAATLGAKWTIARSVEVGCDLSRERRTSDVPSLSLPYSSNSVGCYGQFTLQ